jgi:hypothetical protein
VTCRPAVGAKTATIAPGSPWENGYVESFNARLRDELLDGEIFYALREAEVVIESWRRHDNTVRRTLRSASGHPRRRWCCPPSPPGPRRYPTGRANHTNRGAQADAELTFTADHPRAADQNCHREPARVRSTISSTSAVIISPPSSIEPPGSKPSRCGPRSPVLPLWHSRQCAQPEPRASAGSWPINLTVPPILPNHGHQPAGPCNKVECACVRYAS